MRLHEALAARRDEIMRRWEAQVLGVIAPDGLNATEIRDHLPGFLLEIVAALEESAGLATTGPSRDTSSSPAIHGIQRLRLGFSLDAVVREYGALRHAIVSTARDAGVEISFRELHVLSDAIIAGIAHAVTEYTRQRDAENLRLANEHYAFLAHELRNPLSAALMALRLLKNTGALAPEARAVRALERGLEATTELVERTLQTSRVVSGIDLRPRPTRLRDLLEEAELGALPDAEGRHIDVRLVVATEEIIDLDRRLVGSALGNLLRNAVKYSHEGGTVEARGRVADGHVILEVEDSCGGLAPGKVEEAFAPFVRLDDRQSGFGLGLAIAKQAVDAHGGSIRVQNVPGKGCIFVLELPLVRRPAAMSPGP